MESIKTKAVGTNTLSIVDVAGQKGWKKWGIVRVIRVIETQGLFEGANRTNVVREYFVKKYDARSKKQRIEALTEANKVFDLM